MEAVPRSKKGQRSKTHHFNELNEELSKVIHLGKSQSDKSSHAGFVDLFSYLEGMYVACELGNYI